MNLFKRTAKAVGRLFNFRHRTTEQLLIDQEGEFSELVDTLVAKWVDSLEV